MKEKSVILILALVLLAPFTGVAYTSLVGANNETVEPPIAYAPSTNYTETLGITVSIGRTVLVKHFFDNVSLTTPFTDEELSDVSLLVFSFVGGTWNWNYWPKPFWRAPLGASMKVVFRGISDAEVSDYIQRAKELSLTFAKMYNLSSTVIYLLEYHGGTLIVGLYAQCDVNSVIDLWAESLPSEGLGELFNASVVEDSPFKYLGISLRDPQVGTTLGSVTAIYVRTGAVSEEEGNYTLSVNEVVGHTGLIAASEDAEESFIYLNFPYLANITEVSPEPSLPKFDDWEEWSAYWGKSEMEPFLRRATYGLCGLLVWDLKNMTSPEDIIVSYDFDFAMERLTHRPMILATTTLLPARPELGDDVDLTIILENVGNATAKHILVRPLVFPWLFVKIFEEIYAQVGNWGFIHDGWVTKDFLRSLINAIYGAVAYIPKLEPGETTTVTRTFKFSDWLPKKFFERIKAFYFPMGCHVLYGDEYHRRYMVTSNGYFTGIGTESPALMSTLTLNKYLVRVGEEVNLTLSIKNLGNADISDVDVYIFSMPKLKANLAARFMAHNQATAYLNTYERRVRATWRRFHQLEVYHETVERIGAGETYNITLERRIPWLGGSTTLVAALTFPYDWESYTESTVWNKIPQQHRERLPRRLLLLSNSVNLYLVPGVAGPEEYPQPKLEVSKSFSTDDLSPGTEVDVTVKVTNIGEMPANITVRDLKPTGCNIVPDSITASGGTTFTATIGRPRFRVTVIGVRNLEVNPGETVYLNYTLKITGDISGLDPPVTAASSDEVIIGPAIVTYSSDQPTIDPGTVESTEVLVAGETASTDSGFSLVSYTPGGPSLPRSLIFMGVIGLIAVAAILLLSRRGL